MRYFRVPRLLTDLAIARGDGSYNKLMKDLKGTELLILDDWGFNTLDPRPAGICWKSLKIDMRRDPR